MDFSEIQIQDNVLHQINAKIIIHLVDAHVMLNALEVKFAKIHVVQTVVLPAINAHKVYCVLLDVALYQFAIEIMIALVEMFVLEIVVLLDAVLPMNVQMDSLVFKAHAVKQAINLDNAHLISIVDKMEFVLISNAV
jgi:hypothetical protein